MIMDADTLMGRLHEIEEEYKQLRSLLAEHGIPLGAYAHDDGIAASQSSKPMDSTIHLSLQGLFTENLNLTVINLQLA